jgi:hypothetical protein
MQDDLNHWCFGVLRAERSDGELVLTMQRRVPLAWVASLRRRRRRRDGVPDRRGIHRCVDRPESMLGGACFATTIRCSPHLDLHGRIHVGRTCATPRWRQKRRRLDRKSDNTRTSQAESPVVGQSLLWVSRNRPFFSSAWDFSHPCETPDTHDTPIVAHPCLQRARLK